MDEWRWVGARGCARPADNTTWIWFRDLSSTRIARATYGLCGRFPTGVVSRCRTSSATRRSAWSQTSMSSSDERSPKDSPKEKLEGRSPSKDITPVLRGWDYEPG